MQDMNSFRTDNNKEKVKKVVTDSCDLEMVERNWYALKFVKEQTPEICLAAVQQNPDARKFIRITFD